MENSLKGLLLAAGTIITCIIISLGFYIAREAKDTAATGAGQINALNAAGARKNPAIKIIIILKIYIILFIAQIVNAQFSYDYFIIK